jgi:hypothetical protein
MASQVRCQPVLPCRAAWRARSSHHEVLPSGKGGVRPVLPMMSGDDYSMVQRPSLAALGAWLSRPAAANA